MLALVLAWVSGGAVWGDEVYSLAPIQGTWGELMSCLRLDSHPPLFFVLEKVWYGVFGGEVFAMKSFSIVPTVLTMVLGGVFLKKEVSSRASLLYMLAFFASENILLYSIEIRMYTWALFFVTMSGVCAWYLISRGKWVWAALFLLSAAASAYTHYYAGIVVGIGYVLMWVYTVKYARGNEVKLGVIGVCAVVVYMPWIGIAVESFEFFSKDFWIPPLTGMYIVGWGEFVFKAGRWSAGCILCGLFIGMCWSFFVRKEKQKIEWFGMSGVLCAVILVLVGLGLSLLIRPLFYNRYLLPVCGLIWMFFGIEGGMIKRKWVYRVLCGVLVCIGIVTSSITYAKEKKDGEEFARFHTYVTERLGAGDIFLTSPGDKGNLETMSGMTAYLFKGHAYTYELEGMFKNLIPQYGRMLGSPSFSYRSLSGEEFAGRRAWIIVSERLGSGAPNGYQLPAAAEAEWCGKFGWLFYKFDLYVSENPSAFAQ